MSKKRYVSWEDLENDSSSSSSSSNRSSDNYSIKRSRVKMEYLSSNKEMQSTQSPKSKINLFGPEYKPSKSTQTVIRANLQNPVKFQYHFRKNSKGPSIRGIWWKNAW